MEPNAALFSRPKFPRSINAVDAAADGNNFDQLPESLVHHIFSFLETIDAMRASVVSRSWRYLWTSMPHLDFNHKAIRLWSSYDNYKDFVNWVLMSHDKSVSIKSCRLLFSNNEDDNSVYRWLQILAKKHVQKLYLNLDSNRENPFVLPSCLLASDSLEVLEIGLQSCVLKIPSGAGFSQLKSLKLGSVQLLDQNLFQNFISSCPLLENLSLEECRFPGFKDLDISSRNLRKLVIDTDGFKYPEECDLKITCPNLVYFDLTGTLVKSLSWGENPCFLQTANFDVDVDEVLDDEFADLLEILEGVCHVEILKLCKNILEYISPAVTNLGCFSTIFYNLKTLKLSTYMEVSYMRSIIYLLKGAPNLQFLSVYIDRIEDFDLDCDYEHKILDADIECLTCHLKMVELTNIDNRDADLELIRFLLNHAHVLEKMSIIWGYWLERKTEREGIRKVKKFPRSSSHVNVTFNELSQFEECEFL